MIRSLIFISSVLSSISYIPINDNNIKFAVSLPAYSIAFGDYSNDDFFISDIYSYYYQHTNLYEPFDQNANNYAIQLTYDYKIDLQYYVNKSNLNVYYKLLNVTAELNNFVSLTNGNTISSNLNNVDFITAYPYFTKFDLQEYIDTLQEQEYYNAYFETLFTLNDETLTFKSNVDLFNSFYLYVSSEDIDFLNLYIEWVLPLINTSFTQTYNNDNFNFPYKDLYNWYYSSAYLNTSVYFVRGSGNLLIKQKGRETSVNTLKVMYKDAEIFRDYYKDSNGYDFDTGYNQGYEEGSKIGYDNGYTAGMTAGLEDNTAFTIFNGILNIAMIPVNFFLSIFNFEILGVNMAGFVSALLTISIILYLLRLIKGSKTDD